MRKLFHPSCPFFLVQACLTDDRCADFDWLMITSSNAVRVRLAALKKEDEEAKR
jgi:uroporphyrinogen-III synthase